MAQGHLIPMIDIAKLLAQHGVAVTVITTPVNADRVRSTLTRAIELSGAQISVKEVDFPWKEVGLPKSCENLDQLPSLGLAGSFMDKGDELLQRAVEKIFEELRPKPNCIISDMSFPYTSFLAQKHGIPRISFNGFSSFSWLCISNMWISIKEGFLDGVASDCEPFLVPGMPHPVELTNDKLPFDMIKGMDQFNQRSEAAEALSYGTIFNSFEELEHEYLSVFKGTMGQKAWCVGPVSLCNEEKMDRFHRGNKNSTDGSKCLKWLNSQESCSVVYICLGSICNISTSQLIELGLGLEASGRTFIWAIRDGEASNGLLEWMEDHDFDERIKDRGFVIRGWAPQVAILSHSAIGGFLTHCGWNSTLEGICAGVTMLTWPLFAEQFCNERLVVDVLKIGVEIGAKRKVNWGEEEKNVGAVVKKEDIVKGIEELMGGGDERYKRKIRVKELSEVAKLALKPGGSSYMNIEMLIEDISRYEVGF
uniref:UDP-glycosyltransferase 1 n=1 Tax=Linum usitatissimum TaxID=4006 RepID=I2BH43_LINUS|nr:UDP-glycosyltransferase 1 [Linum usitatissimum]